MFCKDDGQTITFPYGFANLRADNPNVSFNSAVMSDTATLASFNVYPVTDNKPAYDPTTHRLVRNGAADVGGGNYETQYTLELLPSRISGGPREPTSDEIAADLQTGYQYYFWKVQEKIKAVAAADNFMDVSIDQAGNFVATGAMEKAAKYAQLPAGPFKNRASSLLQWESDVWTYLQTRWAGIDPNGDFSGGGATPPTWASLESDIDTNHPVPS